MEVIYKLGRGERLVGVTGLAGEPPPRVSGFSNVNFDQFDALKRDLVSIFSDMLAEASEHGMLAPAGSTLLQQPARPATESGNGRQNVIVVRNPATNASVDPCAPLGFTMNCKSGWMLHHGAICAL